MRGLLLLLSLISFAFSFSLQQLGEEKIVVANARRYPIKDISVLICTSPTSCSALPNAHLRINGSRIISLHGIGPWFSARVTLPDEGSQTLFRRPTAPVSRQAPWHELRRRTNAAAVPPRRRRVPWRRGRN